MKNNFNFLLAVGCMLLLDPDMLYAQAPTIEWDRTIGGNNTDQLSTITPTSDGGFLLSGFSHSTISGDKTENSKGFLDYWVVKTDASGNILWDKTLGGSDTDILKSVAPTLDGGFILGGTSNSSASGDKSEISNGGSDYWVIKIDASGNKVWDKALGGGGEDNLSSVVASSDGGYLLGGYSDSGASGDKSEDSNGDIDYWVVKIDAYGNKVWDKTLGGNMGEYLYSLATTSDEGFLLVGYSNSDASGDKTEDSEIKSSSGWIVKVDATGNKVWDKTIQGYNPSIPNVITPTPDGAFLVGGFSSSFSSGGGVGIGSYYWVAKIDNSGGIIWHKEFGGSGFENLQSITTATNGGFLLGGVSESPTSGDKSEDFRGSGDQPKDEHRDYWVIKIDDAGNKIWDKTIGGNGYDWLYSVTSTLDGGFLLGGYSMSDASGEKTENASGEGDYWIVKLKAENSDNTPPVLSGIPSDVTVGSNEIPAPAEVVAQDNVDGLLPVIFTENKIDGACVSSYTLTRTWAATDAAGNTATASQTVTVINDTPVINNISSLEPQQVSTNFSISASYSDDNLSTASWDWGDGSSSEGNISDSEVTGSHSYTMPGLYTVTLTLTDACGETASMEYEHIVVEDPAAGFVTGGGWFNSPAGAYITEPATEGKAIFGFIAKNIRNTDVRQGTLIFKLMEGNLNFKSYAAEWLVINGNNAFYKGMGTINGSGNYSFLLSVVDVEDKSSPDRIRMQIWDNGGAVVYDNQMGSAVDAEAAMEIGAGSIAIHKGSKNNKADTKEINVAMQVSQSFDGFSAYPIPLSNGGLWLELPPQDKDETLEASIIDLNGRKMATKQFSNSKTGSKQLWELNHQNWPSGMYMLIIRGEGAIHQQKITK